MLNVFISHKFGTNTKEAQRVKRILKEFDLHGIIMGGPDANPPWDMILGKIRSSASLIAIFGLQESRKVHNELGMAWGCRIPCFALVDRQANYDLGIASLVLSYGNRLDFKNTTRFESAIRTIARLIVRQNSQLNNDLETARRTLFSKLRREPSVAEVAEFVRKTPELVSQFVNREKVSDEYGKYGQYARRRLMVTDLFDCWKRLGLGCFEEVPSEISGGIVYRSSSVRRGRWACRFDFLVFGQKPYHPLAWWRNYVCQYKLAEAGWSVIVFLTYHRDSGSFRSFMRSWGGDYSFLPNIKPGTHYFGPGEGYHNVLVSTSKKKIDSMMTPTFILDDVLNKNVLAERVESVIMWIAKNRTTVFPRAVIEKEP
ncbi:MAG: sigma-70 domain-containing protein [Candidatus Bathyarchaeia archaeon]|jgi:hypothetical protein